MSALAVTTARKLFDAYCRLDEWKENVARLCIGNTRLLFAVSAGFAAPLLAPLGKEGGGFHFWDENSKGKTSLLIAAGSTTGGGGKNGYIRRWRATINGLEATAVSHNDILLCLDELAEVDPRKVGETAYMLANGQAKLRMQKNISLGRSAEWLTLFLSSGEISLATHMATAGKQIRGGMDVRLLTFPPMQAQVWDCLKNCTARRPPKTLLMT